MATSGHPSRLAAATATHSPPFSSSFSNSSSTNQGELSAACYIRSLVKKHLMSSSSSSPARSSLHEDRHLNTMANTVIPHDRHHRPQLQQGQAAEQPPPVAVRSQVKKQTRKRTHASRPYQERLLNMAEARREIVTALKIHRANMRHQQPCTHQLRQADTLPSLRQSPSSLQQLRHQEQQRQQVQVAFQDRSQAVEGEGALLAAPASYASYSDHHQLRNPSAHWISPSAAAPAGSCYSSPILPYDLTPPLEVAPMPTAMGGLEQLVRSLPAQPLGLNLSFVQGFGGSAHGARDCEGLFGAVPVVQSTSSSPAASSYTAYSSPATGTYGSPVLSSTAEKYSPSVDAPAPLIATMLDDGDTQSAAGEAHGVEWWGDATAADVTAASAWWSKALHESMDSGGGGGGGGGEVVEGGSAVGCTPEDVAATSSAGLPPADQWRWLCDDGVGEQGAITGTDDDKPPDFIEMLADGDLYACCYDDEGDRRRSDDGGDGITLPCMDGIGDIDVSSDASWNAPASSGTLARLNAKVEDERSGFGAA